MISLAVVCEARADFETVARLTDRSLTQHINWIEDSDLEHHRNWFADGAEQESFYKWSSVKRLSRQAGIKRHGHFDGLPGSPDAVAGRRALHLIQRMGIPDRSAILLIRDQDDQADRLTGLQQAVSEFMAEFHMPVIIGFAVIERESWVLSGFVATNPQESQLLKTIHQELGFDPTTQPQKLTAAKDDTALRSPKRVLQQLTAASRDRALECLETPFATLKANGQQNGLARLLDDIQNSVVSLLMSSQ